MTIEEVKALRHGPDGFDKIAIIGSAPSSMLLAPYDDPSWAIWGCSPGVFGGAPRADVWFELHRWEPAVIGKPLDPRNKPWFSPEYTQFCKQFAGPVYMSAKEADVANCFVYPFAEMDAKHGHFFWTSTMAYMLALALEFKPKAIGLWGVDMAANSEYAFQRPGCQHFLGLAKSLGIEIVLPPESDLLRPSTRYGRSEYSERHIKLLARKRELERRRIGLQQAIEAQQRELLFVQGAEDNMAYIFDSWIDDGFPDIEEAICRSANLKGA